MGSTILLFLILCLTSGSFALPQNYDDIDMSVDQPKNEKVDISQRSPQSNAIHIGHNIPMGSDIKIKQTKPYNTSVHISLNVGSESKVKVEMTNAVNVMLHISMNGMKDSEVEVMLEKTYNTSVHVSFQNPVNTPVKVTMNNAVQSFLHVSQNIPTNSKMEVEMRQPRNSQIHISQAVPRSSGLTWSLQGDPDINQIQVSQNAADSNSPLNCSPDCPQDQTGGGGESSMKTDSKSKGPTSRKSLANKNRRPSGSNRSKGKPRRGQTKIPRKASTQTRIRNQNRGNKVTSKQKKKLGKTKSCPGSSLEECVANCPGKFGPRTFSACVKTCGKRC